MKSNVFLLLAACAFVAVASLVFSGQNTGLAASEAVAQGWEHLAMPVAADDALGGPETSRKINQLGNDGWELVDVETFTKDGSTTKLVYFFKRPKS